MIKKDTCPANIDSAGVRHRWILGVIGIAGAVFLLIWLRYTQYPRVSRVGVYPLFFVGILGILQAKKKFCVAIAQKQEPAMRSRAAAIIAVAAILASLLTWAAYTL